ncbi:FAD-binding domain-containing protein [Hypoxylon rubiginosum]|uniref:FAD-binding domain-containing protein n=1 Tax=Hypoxylon rubiginosum TaxID=110542 RepID=A0ACC0CSQ3_9PEZI|nr:FAD-binding domain-containing protein [Hypoxylon rubiginosum]
MKNRLSVSFWILLGLDVLARAQDAAAWVALNSSVGGRLYSATPLALPCFSQYNGNNVAPDTAACATVRENYRTNTFRADSPAGYMYLQDEMCLGEPLNQCVLDNTVDPALAPWLGTSSDPEAAPSCNQGSVPPYYLEVQEVADITQALTFSRQHGVPLIIKNSGHDFMTRNSQKGSLSLWVHRLDGLAYHDDFVPEGCAQTSSVGRAIAAGTGASTASIMEFASQHGSTFIGGYSPTVAASGGWILGGGHSVLSPVYGLGVDRVAQFTLVTPDGAIRVANACQNEDLFWALRGGGGGTFGVVLEAVHSVEPVMPVAVANILLPANTTVETSLEWIKLMTEESLRWGKEGWGGHAAGLYLTHMNPLPPIANLTDGNAAAQESMRRATEFALSVGGTSVVEVFPDFIDIWNQFVQPGAAATAGTARFLTSRLLPEELFADEAGISKINGLILAAQDLGFDPRNLYVPVTTPFVVDGTGPANGSDMAVNPAWYGALWHISFSTYLPWNSSYEERVKALTTHAKVTPLMEELAGRGSYLNEANPFEPNWQESWWADNYPRLLEIKKKYDPEGVLDCWKCVGFQDEEFSSDRFGCQGKLQLDIDKQT